MTTTITTAEELDALHRAISEAAEPALVRASAALWVIREGEDGELSAGSAYSDGEGLIPASMVRLPWAVLYRPDQPVSAAKPCPDCGLPWSKHYASGVGEDAEPVCPPDQPVSAAPTVEQIAAIILAHFHAPDYGRHESWWLEPNKAAKAVAALYPTCQPSRETVRDALDLVDDKHADCGGGYCLCGKVSSKPEVHYQDQMIDAVLALLPGRSEAEVKAEALQELRIDMLGSAEWTEANFIPGPNSSAYAKACRQVADSIAERAADALRGER